MRKPLQYVVHLFSKNCLDDWFTQVAFTVYQLPGRGDADRFYQDGTLSGNEVDLPVTGLAGGSTIHYFGIQIDQRPVSLFFCVFDAF